MALGSIAVALISKGCKREIFYNIELRKTTINMLRDWISQGSLIKLQHNEQAQQTAGHKSKDEHQIIPHWIEL